LIDLAVVCGYLTLMLIVGWRARRSSPESYWVAERRYGSFPVGASLVATIFGASSTIGIIGLGYSRGLTGAWWSLVGGLALIPFSFVLAGRVRRLGVYTLPDILRKAYGERVAWVGAVVIAVAWCGVVAAQIVAGGLLLGGVLSLPFQGAVGIVAVVFVLYSLLGGQVSVIRTDSWQVTLFVVALVLSLGLVLRAGFLGGALPDGLPLGSLSFPVSSEFGWYQVLVFYPLIVGLPYLVGPDIYSRVLCARNGRAARNAGLLASAAVIPLSFLLALLGLSIHALLPGLTPESALPSAVAALAPVGIKGLIVVGLLGAIMSSADTTLISASTILSLNVVSPVLALKKEAELRVTRGFVVILGAVGWAIAAFQQEIIASLLLAYTVFVGGVVLPTLAAFWKERLGVTSPAALWAVLVGGSVAFLGELQDGILFRFVLGDRGTVTLASVLGPEYGRIFPLVLSVLVLLVVSRFTRSTPGGGTRS
jgi:SSS family solute:Na+ symporter